MTLTIKATIVAVNRVLDPPNVTVTLDETSFAALKAGSVDRVLPRDFTVETEGERFLKCRAMSLSALPVQSGGSKYWAMGLSYLKSELLAYTTTVGFRADSEANPFPDAGVALQDWKLNVERAIGCPVELVWELGVREVNLFPLRELTQAQTEALQCVPRSPLGLTVNIHTSPRVKP